MRALRAVLALSAFLLARAPLPASAQAAGQLCGPACDAGLQCRSRVFSRAGVFSRAQCRGVVGTPCTNFGEPSCGGEWDLYCAPQPGGGGACAKAAIIGEACRAGGGGDGGGVGAAPPCIAGDFTANWLVWCGPSGCNTVPDRFQERYTCVAGRCASGYGWGVQCASSADCDDGFTCVADNATPGVSRCYAKVGGFESCGGTINRRFRFTRDLFQVCDESKGLSCQATGAPGGQGKCRVPAVELGAPCGGDTGAECRDRAMGVSCRGKLRQFVAAEPSNSTDGRCKRIDAQEGEACQPDKVLCRSVSPETAAREGSISCGDEGVCERTQLGRSCGEGSGVACDDGCGELSCELVEPPPREGISAFAAASHCVRKDIALGQECSTGISASARATNAWKVYRWCVEGARCVPEGAWYESVGVCRPR